MHMLLTRLSQKMIKSFVTTVALLTATGIPGVTQADYLRVLSDGDVRIRNDNCASRTPAGDRYSVWVRELDRNGKWHLIARVRNRTVANVGAFPIIRNTKKGDRLSANLWSYGPYTYTKSGGTTATVGGVLYYISMRHPHYLYHARPDLDGVTDFPKYRADSYGLVAGATYDSHTKDPKNKWMRIFMQHRLPGAGYAGGYTFCADFYNTEYVRE